MKKAIISLITLTLAATTMAGQKFTIYKQSCSLDKFTQHKKIISPKVSIKNNAMKSTIQTRPHITISVLISTAPTGSLKVHKLTYDWEKENWAASPAADPAGESTKQPACDYKKIKNTTLRRNPESRISFDMQVPPKSKILATKARLYIAGQLIDEQETKERACTWTDWENI